MPRRTRAIKHTLRPARITRARLLASLDETYPEGQPIHARPVAYVHPASPEDPFWFRQHATPAMTDQFQPGSETFEFPKED